MEMNTLTKSIEEIEAKIHPQNRKLVGENTLTQLLLCKLSKPNMEIVHVGT